MRLSMQRFFLPRQWPHTSPATFWMWTADFTWDNASPIFAPRATPTPTTLPRTSIARALHVSTGVSWTQAWEYRHEYDWLRTFSSERTPRWSRQRPTWDTLWLVQTPFWSNSTARTATLNNWLPSFRLVEDRSANFELPLLFGDS